MIPGNRNIGFTTTYVVLTSNQITEFCFSLPRTLLTSRSVVNNQVYLTLCLIETLIDNESLNTLSTLIELLTDSLILTDGLFGALMI